MKKIIIVSLLSLSFTSAQAQTNQTFFLGHSLINFNVPNMVDQMSIASTQTFSYDANIGNGAFLGYHWNNPTSGQGDQWDLTLPNGGYENFIVTEAVPLENQLQFNDTYRYADSLYSFAEQYNPNIQYYIYETWHCINSGNGSTSGSGGTPCDWDPGSTVPWRDRLDNDLIRWESILDSMDLIHANPTYLIPGGQALGRLADSIENGSVAGLSSVFDLFVDVHHLDNRGNYFIACVMYSVIHGTSPVGLPNQLMDPFGSLYTVYPTPEQALIMQEIAWETICEYNRDGVECTASISTQEMSNITVFPVPAREHLSIKYDAFSGVAPYSICDHLGKVLLSGEISTELSTINVSELSSGSYLLIVNDQRVKFVK